MKLLVQSYENYFVHLEDTFEYVNNYTFMWTGILNISASNVYVFFYNLSIK